MGQAALPKAGDLIGVRYRIESLLGQGGMGAVFAAVNQATGRAVAIKWMLPGAARSQEAVARFLAEARATAKIEHPNVIQILDVGQDGEAPFLVMERLRGESLADRLERAGRLTPDEALRVMIPACKGVAEAHAEGIIHRDLKPDNIFLCQGKDGSPRPSKVLDFGISKLFDEDQPGQGAPMTRTGIAMGTPWYMSPEQINASGTPDARYDVYAMGVVLYECLAGRPPYNADGLFELVQQIASGHAAPLRSLAPDVPPDLEAATMRAMHVDRNQRPATMKELVAELERIQARMQTGQPAPAIPHTAGAMMHGGQAYTPTPHGAPPTGPAGWSPQPSGGYGAPPSGPIAAPVSSSGGGGGGLKLIVFALGGLVALGILAVIGIGVGIFAFAGSGDDSGGGVTSGGGGGGGGGILGGGGSPLQPSNPRDPQIDLTFSGTCDPVFQGRRMVTGNAGTVSVLAMNGSTMTGSLQLALPASVRGTQQLSTQHRMDTQAVVNMMVGQSIWTNMTMDLMAVRNGRIPDPVSGTMIVHQFDDELATVDIEFRNASLQNMRDGSSCTINGRLRTNGTTYGM
ncbi:MAG: protein kinase [Myxococcota bacterium]|nr:protein kinase [Myxococcota bacterium]